MNRGMKVLAIATLSMAASAMTQGLFANCVNEGPYELRQCSKGAWFGVKPPTAGAHTAKWWAIGFGNGDVVTPGTAAETLGNGLCLLLNTPGVHCGIDSGTLDNVALDLVDAEQAGIGAPAGTLCFSASANWGSPGLDSCIDINRNETSGNGTASASDNIVNKYWDATPQPPGYGDSYPDYYNHQLDPPMGVLLTEATGQFFAAAFVASIPKAAPRDENPDPGQYSLGDVNNGDTGPFGTNLIPWQQVPKPNVAATLSNPADPLSPRNLSINWTNPRFLNDGSVRPCYKAPAGGTTPCTSLGGANGVGVLDQGPLIHFSIESSPIDAAGNCGATWTAIGGAAIDFPGSQLTVNGVAPDTCVRLRTSFGRTPSVAFRQCTPTPPATICTAAQFTTVRDLNRLDTQQGRMGDIGYFVASTPVKVGGQLVSQKATLTAASKEKGALHVAFSTDTELNVTGFDIVGIDGKGGRKVLGSVSCTQCTTGVGASYDELISGAKAGSTKKVQVVMQPSGTVSNTLDVK